MKLSIITINFNNRDGLRKTIESVVNQTWQEFEYIIIDGGSTDGSVEVIKEYADRIDYWVSEPDKGIYDAMNKGIDQAKGEYCLFMNSGDCIYRPTTLEEVYTELNGTDIISGRTLTDIKEVKVSPIDISFSYLYQFSLCHQSILIRTEVMKSLKYDTSYSIISDWKFLYEALILHNGSYKAISTLIAVYNTAGVSSVNIEQLKQEKIRLMTTLLPPRVLRDYDRYYNRATKEELLYRILSQHKFHKMFYMLNLLPFKLLSLFSKRTKWVKGFPFKI